MKDLEISNESMMTDEELFAEIEAKVKELNTKEPKLNSPEYEKAILRYMN